MADEATDETVVEEVTEEVAAEVDADAPTTEETTEDDGDTQEVESSEPSTETEPAKKDKVQKRIDELTADIYELRQDRDYFRDLSQKKAEEPEVKSEPVVKTLADFEYDEGKFAEHIRDTVTAEVKQTFQNEVTQQDHARKEAEFRSSEAKYARKNADYYAVTNTPGLEISPDLAGVLKESDMGPEVFYHLGKNLGAASKLSRLPYTQMLKEVVKLESNLSRKTVEKSKAPPPAPKLEVVNEKAESGPGKTQESFEKWRAKYRR